mmetsp:Transcript_27382/g.42511  ORF Transcript_27382/g.42511 Transcript_27382/m.42511 type:complete len:98 (+) Transcript_27382:324-617(+)
MSRRRNFHQDLSKLQLPNLNMNIQCYILASALIFMSGHDDDDKTTPAFAIIDINSAFQTTQIRLHSCTMAIHNESKMPQLTLPRPDGCKARANIPSL